MSSNDQNNSDNMSRHRRSSVTSAALSGIFRSASTSAPHNSSASTSTSTAANGTPIFPNSLDSRRRLSISTTAALGLGSVPNSANPAGVGAQAFAMRRASLSTNSSTSEGVDESAIEDDDSPPMSAGGARTNSVSNNYSNAQNGPFSGRRVSFGAQAGRPNGRQRSIFATQQPNSPSSPLQASPVAPSESYFPPSASARRSSVLKTSHSRSYSSSSYAAPLSPIAGNTNGNGNTRTVSDKIFFPATRADQGYNWPEQLRSRAESTISGARSSFSHVGISHSPPRISGFANYGTSGANNSANARHDRAKSVSDVPRQAAPVPAQPAPRPEARKKPDPFQERILKGDFYMD